jgi:hypothetical protein
MYRPCPAPLCRSVYKSGSWLAKHITRHHKELSVDSPFEDQNDDDASNYEQDSFNIEEDELRSDLERTHSLWDNNQRIPIPLNADAAEIVDRSDEDPDEDTGIKDGAIIFESAGEGVLLNEDEEDIFNDSKSPFWPFLNSWDYNLAKFLIATADSKASHIDAFFKSDLGLDASIPRSFKSSHTLRRQIDLMPDGLGWESWMKYTTTKGWSESNSEPITYYCRNPVEIAEWLLAQPCHRKDMVYGPVREYVDGQRVYSEMHTADWWWEMQVIEPFSSSFVQYPSFS